MWPKILPHGVSAEWGLFVSDACTRVHLGCVPLLPVLTWLHGRAWKGAPVPMAMDTAGIDQSCRRSSVSSAAPVSAQPLQSCSSLGTDAWEVCAAPFSLRVGCHSGTVNFCWFLLEWQGGTYHLSQALYQSCRPPSSLEFMRSCRVRKCVMDVFVHCTALAASLFLCHLVHQALVILCCWDTQPVPV